MLLIGLKSDVQVVSMPIVVFILKLILSYLAVHLTDSLPTSPLAGCRHGRIGSVSEGLTCSTGGVAGRMIQAARYNTPQ